MVKNLPAKAGDSKSWRFDPSLGDPLESEMVTCSSILAGKFHGQEGPGGLQSMRSQRVGHNRATEHAHGHKSHPAACSCC